MIAKRIGAGALAVLLILGAWLVRDRVIDDDGADATSGDDSGGDDGDSDPGEILYCINELRPTCDAIADQYESLDVLIAPAGSTLDELGAGDTVDVMWLTIAPLPEMVNALRQSRNLALLDHAATTLASSPLSLVVRPLDTDQLVAACSDPVDLACLVDVASLRPTFADLDTASGMLGVAAASAAFGGETLDIHDPQYAVWARTVKGARATSLSGGTAVQTIQTRPTFGIAIGADAELTDAKRPEFDVLMPAQPVRLDVVLMVPDGVGAPSGLARAASASLSSAGWDAAAPDGTPTGLPAPGVILAVRDIWEDLR